MHGHSEAVGVLCAISLEVGLILDIHFTYIVSSPLLTILLRKGRDKALFNVFISKVYADCISTLMGHFSDMEQASQNRSGALG